MAIMDESPPVDFRELLKKYMDRVSRAEGVFFTPLVPDDKFSRTCASKSVATKRQKGDHRRDSLVSRET